MGTSTLRSPDSGRSRESGTLPLGITELSEHEANGGEFEERQSPAVEAFPILGQSAASVQPADRAFHDPAPGLHDEAFGGVGALDDFDLEQRQDFRQRFAEPRTLVGRVGEQFPQQREHARQRREQRDGAVAILHAGRGDVGAQEKSLGVDQEVPLLALDQLARVEAMRIDADPPFSALFTLWLSTTQAVGSSRRSAFSRHRT